PEPLPGGVTPLATALRHDEAPSPPTHRSEGIVPRASRCGPYDGYEDPLLGRRRVRPVVSTAGEGHLSLPRAQRGRGDERPGQGRGPADALGGGRSQSRPAANPLRPPACMTLGPPEIEGRHLPGRLLALIIDS